MVRQTARGQGCCAGGCCCPSSAERGRVPSTASPGTFKRQEEEPILVLPRYQLCHVPQNLKDTFDSWHVGTSMTEVFLAVEEIRGGRVV